MINNNSHYTFTPAYLLSNFIPLVIILDDDATHFEYKMWNVLTPHEALLNNAEEFENVVTSIVEEHECEEHIYVYAQQASYLERLPSTIVSQVKALYVENVDETYLQGNANIFSAHQNFPLLYVSNSVSDSLCSMFLERYAISAQKEQMLLLEGSMEHQIQTVMDFLARMESYR